MRGTDAQRIEGAWRTLGLPPSASLALEPLAGQASARRYIRVGDAQDTWMAMLLPDSERAEEIGGGGGAAPFLQVQEFLRDRSLPVPHIYGYDRPSGVVLLEDLGDWTFERCLYEQPDFADPDICWQDIGTAYGRAVDLLIQFQCQTRDAFQVQGPWRDRGFDHALLYGEWRHFVEYLLVEGLGAPGFLEDAAVTDGGERLVEAILKLPYGLTHRDFQSRNLMLTPRGLVLIDFQDALAGPYIYDLVALLRDSYVVIPDDMLFSLLRRFHGRGVEAGLFTMDFEHLRAHFDLVTLHRKAKDAGRFVFIDRVKGNPDFLVHIPASVGYVLDALDRLEAFADLKERIAPSLRAAYAQEPAAPSNI
jgi:aminoglycoside/choline kinase family phosphotransferase